MRGVIHFCWNIYVSFKSLYTSSRLVSHVAMCPTGRVNRHSTQWASNWTWANFRLTVFKCHFMRCLQFFVMKFHFNYHDKVIKKIPFTDQLDSFRPLTQILYTFLLKYYELISVVLMITHQFYCMPLAVDRFIATNVQMYSILLSQTFVYWLPGPFFLRAIS